MNVISLVTLGIVSFQWLVSGRLYLMYVNDPTPGYMCCRDMAAALIYETVWYDKWRCDDAERDYYTRLGGGVPQGGSGEVAQVDMQSVA